MKHGGHGEPRSRRGGRGAPVRSISGKPRILQEAQLSAVSRASYRIPDSRRIVVGALLAGGLAGRDKGPIFIVGPAPSPARGRGGAVPCRRRTAATLPVAESARQQIDHDESVRSSVVSSIARHVEARSDTPRARRTTEVGHQTSKFFFSNATVRLQPRSAAALS